MAEKDRLRTNQLRVWLSDTEYEIAKDKANYSGLSLSTLVRGLIVDGAIIHYEPFAIKEVCDEINKIGNNINQIAKKVNERNAVIEDDIETLRAEYEKLFNLYIDKVMGG